MTERNWRDVQRYEFGDEDEDQSSCDLYPHKEGSFIRYSAYLKAVIEIERLKEVNRKALNLLKIDYPHTTLDVQKILKEDE